MGPRIREGDGKNSSFPRRRESILSQMGIREGDEENPVVPA
jgi:hypothetical protein